MKRLNYNIGIVALVLCIVVIGVVALTAFGGNVEYVGGNRMDRVVTELQTSVNNLAAGGTLTNTLTVAKGITATAGGVTATAGGVTATAGGVTATAGGVTATAGGLTVTGAGTAGRYISVAPAGTGANTNVLLNLGTSITIGADGAGTLVETNTTGTAEYGLRCKINGAVYFILLEKE
jgi:hypothetical protein